MNLEDLEVNKYTASISYETYHIEFYLEFEWIFTSFDADTNETTVGIWLDKGEQWCNNVCHPYTPNSEELKELKTAIEDSILEDPERFDVWQWHLDNIEYYNDLNNDRDER